MKRFFACTIFAIFSASVSADSFYPYASIALGYKLKEAVYNFNFTSANGTAYRYTPNFGSKDTAILEAGFETNHRFIFGVKHDSHVFTGSPFNGKPEYYKTELFVRYKIGGKQ